jgi:hypothetical protein
LQLSTYVSIGDIGYDIRLIRKKSQQPHGPYAQQYQGILKSIPDLKIEAVQSLSVEVTRNQQLAISQRGVLAYSRCTSFTSRMFHSFLNFLVLLATTRSFLHSSFFLSTSKRPSTFLSVILHIISALLTFFHLLPTLSLSLSLSLSLQYILLKVNTHTVLSVPSDSEIHWTFDDDRIKSAAVRSFHVA